MAITADEEFRTELGNARRRMLERLQSSEERLNVDKVEIDLKKLQGLRNRDLEQELNDYLIARVNRELLSREFSQTFWNKWMWRVTFVLAAATTLLAIATVFLALR